MEPPIACGQFIARAARKRDEYRGASPLPENRLTLPYIYCHVLPGKGGALMADYPDEEEEDDEE